MSNNVVVGGACRTLIGGQAKFVSPIRTYILPSGKIGFKLCVYIYDQVAHKCNHRDYIFKVVIYDSMIHKFPIQEGKFYLIYDFFCSDVNTNRQGQSSYDCILNEDSFVKELFSS